MTNEEKYLALRTYIGTGENPALFKFDMLDFLDDIYSAFCRIEEYSQKDGFEGGGICEQRRAFD